MLVTRGGKYIWQKNFLYSLRPREITFPRGHSQPCQYGFPEFQKKMVSLQFPLEIVGHLSLSRRIFPQEDYSTKYHRETLPPKVLALSLRIETLGKHADLVVIVEFFSFEFNQYLKYSLQDYEIFVIKDNILDIISSEIVVWWQGNVV